MRIKLGAFAEKQRHAIKGERMVIRQGIFMVISFYLQFHDPRASGSSVWIVRVVYPENRHGSGRHSPGRLFAYSRDRGSFQP